MDLRTPAAVLGTLTLAAGLVATAAPAEAAPRPTFTTVRALPHVGHGDHLGTGDGGRGTVRLNSAVSSACNAGNPIVAPQWYFLGEKTTGSLRVAAKGVWYPRGAVEEPTGTAIVDHWTGKVLTCSTEDFSRWKKPVDVVAYLARPFDDTNPWGPLDLNVLIDRVAGSAPANDAVSTAQEITTLPFSTAVDTSLADDDGPWLTNPNRCALPQAAEFAQAGTIWFRYTPATTGPAPRVSVAATTNWQGANHGGGLRSGFLEPLPDGSTRLVENVDEWDCDSPVTLIAGTSYLFGVGFVSGADSDSIVATGGPITVSLWAERGVHGG